MAEYLGLAVDIGAYFVFSYMERRLKENLYEIRDNVPILQSHEAVKRKLRDAPNGEIPYARLDGRVEASEQPLHTSNENETAVFRVTEKYRIRRDRLPTDPSRLTTTIERKVASEVEHVPFCVALNKDAGKYAKADAILKLKQFGKTVQFIDFDQIGNSIRRETKLFGKKFYPDNECLTEYEISKLKTRSGVQTEEYLMRSGTPITAIGRVSWADENRKQIQIGCPESTHRLILSSDVDSVLVNMEEEAHRYNVARRTAIIVGVVFLYVALDRFYRDFRIWWKKVKR